MKLKIAFSVQSGCFTLFSLGALSLSRPRNRRSAACHQTVIPSLNRSICAFASATGSFIILVVKSKNAPPSADDSPTPICPEFDCPERNRVSSFWLLSATPCSWFAKATGSHVCGVGYVAMFILPFPSLCSRSREKGGIEPASPRGVCLPIANNAGLPWQVLNVMFAFELATAELSWGGIRPAVGLRSKSANGAERERDGIQRGWQSAELRTRKLKLARRWRYYRSGSGVARPLV